MSGYLFPDKKFSPFQIKNGERSKLFRFPEKKDGVGLPRNGLPDLPDKKFSPFQIKNGGAVHDHDPSNENLTVRKGQVGLLDFPDKKFPLFPDKKTETDTSKWTPRSSR